MATQIDNQQPQPRIEVVDALRGFAVMAIILLHNIEHFNLYSSQELSSGFMAAILVRQPALRLASSFSCFRSVSAIGGSTITSRARLRRYGARLLG